MPGNGLVWNGSAWAPSAVTASNSDMVDGYHAGNASSMVAVSNGTACTGLNADLLDGNHASALANYWNNSGTYIYPNTPSSNSNIQLNGPSYALYASNGSNTAIRADNNSSSNVTLYSYNASTGSCNSARIEGSSTSGYPALWCYNTNGPGLSVQGSGSSYYHTYLNGGSSSAPALGVNGFFTATDLNPVCSGPRKVAELMFCVEAPDVEFYTNGSAQLVNGTATVEFERLLRKPSPRPGPSESLLSRWARGVASTLWSRPGKASR